MSEPARRPDARGGVTVLGPVVSLMVSLRGDRWPEPGDDGAPVEIALHPGGQGYWIAHMSAVLGARTRLCCPLGGPPGLALRPLIQADGVEVAAVDAHRSNSVWISAGHDGDPATVAETPPPPLDRHELDHLSNTMLAWGLRSAVGVLAGVPEQGMVGPDVYQRVTHDLRRNGVVVVADVSRELLDPVAEAGVSILKVSHEDLLASGRASDDSKSAVVGAASELVGTGAELVLVSRAHEPALVVTAGGVRELCAPRLEPANPRGAGDSMTGALAAGIARGLSLPEALTLASAAGALNVDRRGLGTGDRGAIEVLAKRVDLRPVERLPGEV